MKKLFFIIYILTVCVAFNAITAAAASTLYAATLEGELPLYLSPEEKSFVIEKIPACAEIKLMKNTGTWGLVVFENRSGWINLSFTRASYEEAAEATGADVEKTVKVTAPDRKVQLYNLPTTVAKYGNLKKYTVPNGMVLKITRETTSGWGLVSMNGEYAWVQLGGVTDYQTQTQETVSKYDIYSVYALSQGGTGISLYANPGKGDVVAIIPDCVRLTVRETKGGYASVAYDGLNGWIDLKHTTASFSYAQANAGEQVNSEYQTATGENYKNINIYSVPSDKSDDGIVVGTVKGGRNIFVQRRTVDGWCLINYEGVVGWIAPGSCVPSEKTEETVIIPYENKKTGYIATDKNSGAKIYAMYDGSASYATIPECVKVDVLAQRDGFRYVCCDYASGWISEENIAESYSASVSKNKLDKKRTYTLTKDALFSNIPTDIPLYGSREIAIIKAGTRVDVIRVVTTGNEKWGLTENSGELGWVNLSGAQTMLYDYEMIIINAVRIIFAALIIAVVMIVIFRKRKVKTNEKKTVL